MKRIFYSYLNGLHQLMRKVDDTELYVLMIIIFFEFLMVGFLTSRYNIDIPVDTFLPNKWLSRLVGGVGLYSINKYIFGFREKNYSQYQAMPQSTTLIITFLYFGIFILLLIFKDNMPLMKLK